MVELIFLLKAPKFADGLYDVLSLTPTFQIKSGTTETPVAKSSLRFQGCLIRPNSSFTRTFSHSNLDLTLDMDFCKTRLGTFVASLRLNLYIEGALSTSPSAMSELNVYSNGTTTRDILSRVPQELSALPYVKNMMSQDHHAVVQPNSHWYTIISPPTNLFFFVITTPCAQASHCLASP